MEIPVHLEWIVNFLIDRLHAFTSKSKFTREIRPEVYSALSEYRPLLYSSSHEKFFEHYIYSLAILAIDPNYNFHSSSFQAIEIRLQQALYKVDFSIVKFKTPSINNFEEYDKLASDIMLYYLKSTLSSTKISQEITSTDYHSYEIAFEKWTRSITGNSTQFRSDFIYDICTCQSTSVILSKVRPDLVRMDHISFGSSLSRQEISQNWSEIEVALIVLGVRKPISSERADKLCMICFLADLYISISPLLIKQENSIFSGQKVNNPKPFLRESNDSAAFPFTPSSYSYLQKIDSLLDKINELADPVLYEMKQRQKPLPPLFKPVNIIQPTIQPQFSQYETNPSIFIPNQESIKAKPIESIPIQKDNFETELQIIRQKPKQQQNQSKNDFLDDEETDSSLIEAEKIPQRIVKAQMNKNNEKKFMNIKRRQQIESIPISEQRLIFQKVKDHFNKKNNNNNDDDQSKFSPDRFQKPSKTKIVKPSKEGELYSNFQIAEQVKQRQKIQSKKPEQSSSQPNSPNRHTKRNNRKPKEEKNEYDYDYIEYEYSFSSSSFPSPRRNHHHHQSQSQSQHHHQQDRHQKSRKQIFDEENDSRRQKSSTNQKSRSRKNHHYNGYDDNDDEYDLQIHQHKLKSHKNVPEYSSDELISNQKTQQKNRKKNEGSYYDNYQRRKQLLEKDQQKQKKSSKSPNKEKKNKNEVITVPQKTNNSQLKSKIPTKSKKSPLQNLMNEKEQDSIQRKHKLYQNMVPNIDGNENISISQDSEIIPIKNDKSNKENENKNSKSKSKFKSLIESSSILKSDDSNSAINDSEFINNNKFKSGGSSSIKSFLEIERKLKENQRDNSYNQNFEEEESTSQNQNAYYQNFEEEEEEEILSENHSNYAQQFTDEEGGFSRSSESIHNEFDKNHSKNPNSFNKKKNESYISEYDINSLKLNDNIESSSKMPSDAVIDDISIFSKSDDNNSFSIPVNNKESSKKQNSSRLTDPRKTANSSKLNDSQKSKNNNDDSIQADQSFDENGSESKINNEEHNSKIKDELNKLDFLPTLGSSDSDSFEDPLIALGKVGLSSSDLLNEKTTNNKKQQDDSDILDYENDKPQKEIVSNSENQEDNSTAVDVSVVSENGNKNLSEIEEEEDNYSNAESPKNDDDDFKLSSNINFVDDENIKSKSSSNKVLSDEDSLIDDENKVTSNTNTNSNDDEKEDASSNSQNENKKEQIENSVSYSYSYSYSYSNSNSNSQPHEKSEFSPDSNEIAHSEPHLNQNTNSSRSNSSFSANENRVNNHRQEFTETSHLSAVIEEEEEENDEPEDNKEKEHQSTNSNENDEKEESNKIQLIKNDDDDDELFSLIDSIKSSSEDEENHNNNDNDDNKNNSYEYPHSDESDSKNAHTKGNNSQINNQNKNHSSNNSKSLKQSDKLQNEKLHNESDFTKDETEKSQDQSIIIDLETEKSQNQSENDDNDNNKSQDYSINIDIEDNKSQDQSFDADLDTENSHNKSDFTKDETEKSSDNKNCNSSVESEKSHSQPNSTNDETESPQSQSESSDNKNDKSSVESEKSHNQTKSANDETESPQSQYESSDTENEKLHNESDFTKYETEKSQDQSQDQSIIIDLETEKSQNQSENDDNDNDKSQDQSINIEIEDDKSQDKSDNDKLQDYSINIDVEDNKSQDQSFVADLDTENLHNKSDFTKDETEKSSDNKNDNSSHDDDKSPNQSIIIDIEAEESGNQSKITFKENEDKNQENIEEINFSFSDSSDNDEPEVSNKESSSKKQNTNNSSPSDANQIIIEEEEEENDPVEETNKKEEIERNKNKDEFSSAALSLSLSSSQIKKPEDLPSSNANENQQKSSDKDEDEIIDDFDVEDIDVDVEEINSDVDADVEEKKSNFNGSLSSSSSKDSIDILNEAETPTVILTKIPVPTSDDQKTAQTGSVHSSINDKDKSKLPLPPEKMASTVSSPIRKSDNAKLNDENDSMRLSISSNVNFVDDDDLSDKPSQKLNDETNKNKNSQKLNKTESPIQSSNHNPNSSLKIDQSNNALTLDSNLNKSKQDQKKKTSSAIESVDFGDDFPRHHNSTFDMTSQNNNPSKTTPVNNSKESHVNQSQAASVIQSQTVIHSTLRNENEFSAIEPKSPTPNNAKMINNSSDSLIFSDDEQKEKEEKEEKTLSKLGSDDQDDDIFNSVITLPSDSVSNSYSKHSINQSPETENKSSDDKNDNDDDLNMSDISLGTQNLPSFNEETEKIKDSIKKEKSHQSQNSIELSDMSIKTDNLPQFDDKDETDLLKSDTEESPEVHKSENNEVSPIESGNDDDDQDILISGEIVLPDEEENNKIKSESEQNSSPKSQEEESSSLNFTDDGQTNSPPPQKNATNTIQPTITGTKNSNSASFTKTETTNQLMQNHHVSSPIFIESSKIQFKVPQFEAKKQHEKLQQEQKEKTNGLSLSSPSADFTDSTEKPTQPVSQYPRQIHSPVTTQRVTFDKSLVKASRKDHLNQPIQNLPPFQAVVQQSLSKKEEIPLSAEDKEMINDYLKESKGQNKAKYQSLSTKEEKVLLQVLPRATKVSQQDLYESIASGLNVRRTDPICHKIIANITTFLGHGETDNNNNDPLSKTSAVHVLTTSANEEEDDDSDYF